jgi:hypothetical protein
MKRTFPKTESREDAGATPAASTNLNREKKTQ